MPSTSSNAPIVVVHGGAGAWSEERLPFGVAGCESAAAAGARALSDGALAAVVAAVKVLEADPFFNAGFGATLTRAGTVELDAAIMSGDLRFGAVGACPPVESAVELAFKLLEGGEHAFLVGEGARDFAREAGINEVGADALVTDWARERFEEIRSGGSRSTDGATVGAVAVDASGRLTAATSTGGTPYKRVGRVGDTPLIGAGTYADDEAGGAASATGTGESILRVLLCREAVDRVKAGASAEEAAGAALAELERRVGGQAGLIVVDREGRIFAGRNTEAMPWAACRPGEGAFSGY